ncbi:permease [Iocasia frigidifontis]|uniref:Permease n=1 Tax=Iocasia fonsfrigidae TaxID=2682810 RepID=A0A8A7K876_9FIRM|nr:permease [Iocasia fonsfrigidae]QTL97400.1 permease [Iocasia fonsfrigidae]
MSKSKKFLLYLAAFLGAFYIPFSNPTIKNAILESFLMLQEYAREHVILCLVPAFFIAGAIANFISQQSVIKYFGGQAKKWISYSVASVSGTILAVCSCTVLPLFAGIYKRGAGIGPAIAFLYSGPAINVLAIILTARILGWQLGLARAVGAVIFALIIGLLMAVIFRKDDQERLAGTMMNNSVDEEENRSGLQNIFYFLSMVLILVFANWARPADMTGIWAAIYKLKWPVTIILLVFLVLMLIKWFKKEELSEWLESTWGFAEQILPLLFAGVLVAGFLMGRPDTNAGIIPAEWVSRFVGGNSLLANFTASILGAFMYFATLTEVPILQGLIGLGMGKGPALALLLAGPALSLPNMLVIRSVIGTKKTVVFVSLVVAMATITGLIYGVIA